LFKQESIHYFYQFKFDLKIITTIVLHGRRGVPPRPSMLVRVMCDQEGLTSEDATLKLKEWAASIRPVFVHLIYISLLQKENGYNLLMYSN
jgi:hypothetical protein